MNRSEKHHTGPTQRKRLSAVGGSFNGIGGHKKSLNQHANCEPVQHNKDWFARPYMYWLKGWLQLNWLNLTLAKAISKERSYSSIASSGRLAI